VQLRNVKPLLVAVALALGAGAVSAQTYPAKAVRLIVPFAPGGSTDILARTLSIPLGQEWKQPVVIDNRPGGGTLVGTQLGATAPADGYTVLVTNIAYTLIPSVHGQQGADAARRLRGVAQLVSQPTVVAVNPALPVKNVSELLAYAKSKPAAVNFGTSGVGSVGHLAGEVLRQRAGVDITHVPYKGGAPAAIDTMTGQIQVVMVGLPTVMSYVKAGKLKMLAVTDPKRAAAMPDVPTVAEAGLPGYSVTNWVGALVPGAAAPAVVDRLNRDLVAAIKSKDIAGKLEAQGFEIVGGAATAFDRFVQQEIGQWTAVVKKAGITQL
jgi:tripartite-type tricarboxylate transporter receptor subunit TctC